MPLYLTETDVAGLVDMRAAMTVIEEVFAAKSRGEAVNRPRVRVPLVDGNYNVMAASWAAHGVVGQKSFTAGPAGVALDVMLYDAAGGGLLAIIEGKRLTQLRTGAASGVATSRLHAGDGRPIALIGTGIQATSQLEAVALATNATHARVFSRSERHRTTFAESMSQRLELDVTPSDSIESCVDGAGVIVTVTNSTEPVLQGDWLSPGVHVVAAGSNSWLRSELDLAAVERCDRIVVDDVEQAKIECGDLLRAVELGRLSWASVEELGDIVTGRTIGRTSSSEITLFESQGIALEDVALAERVFRLALERGIGAQVP
jgi:alanine dehydrogenase